MFCEQPLFIFNRLVVKIFFLRIAFILYVIKRLFDWTNLSIFLNCSLLFFISWTTVKYLQVIIISSIIYSSSIVLWSFIFLDLKYPSSYSNKPSFVDFWPVCVIFIVSVFIDPETFPWVRLQIVSGKYTNRTYTFSSPAGLWKVVVRVTVFVILPVAINTLIVIKADPKVIQDLICVVKCWTKGH